MYEDLTARAEKILKSFLKLSDFSVQWVHPQEISHGDVSTAIALQVAKAAGKSPRDIAELLLKELQASPEVEKAEIAGPGYVNVWLTSDALLKALNESRKACTAKVTRKKEAPVIVEYSDPNIAKPLGVHHILATVIGQAVANLYQHAGYNVISWNYIGDWGTQFGKLAVAYEMWGGGKPASECTIDELLDLYVRFHAELENDSSLEEKGREAFKKMEQGDKALRAFWNDVVTVTKKSLNVVYERLHISFDLDLGESFYEDKMEAVIKEGIEKKVFVEGEGGALIVEFPNDSNLPPYMVRKSDGATLYATRDLAQMRYRMDTYSPSEILIFTDIAQKLYFEQLEATCDQLEWELPQFENVLFGRMRFADKSMSTRKGNVLKLEDVVDESVRRAGDIIAGHGDSIQADDIEDLAEMMGTGALSYGILSQNRKMDIVFDWDKMLSFEGNSAPYLQYTHARACSVLRKAEESDAAIPDDVESFTDEERSLLITLLEFELVLEEARSQHMPHVLANYLFKLCQEYNSFYNNVPILKAEGPSRTLRLALSASTAEVIQTGAKILTIRVPDRM